MSRLDEVRKSLELTPDELAAAGVTTHAIPPIPAPPRRPRISDDSMDELRTLFVRHAYATLLKPTVLARLEAHLLAEDAKLSLKAFEVVLAALLPHTKPEQKVGAIVPITVEMHVPAPREIIESVDLVEPRLIPGD